MDILSDTSSDLPRSAALEPGLPPTAAQRSWASRLWGGRSWLRWLPGLIAVAALGVGVLLWQKLAGIQEQLAHQSAESQAMSLEARTLARQSLSLAQEASARTVLFDTRLSEVALQRTQLDELVQSLSRSRDENLVVDIESALRLAQQQAQLTGSIEPLMAALKSADQRVSRAAQPRLALLQRALARDIDRVRSASVSDTPTMLVKLDELVRMADELPLSNAAQGLHAQDKSTATLPLAAPSWWQQGLALIVEEAQSLVRLSHIESPDAALLSPEQSFFVRENLKLKLLNARLGLLSRQIESARADLSAADSVIKKYFDSGARKTQTAQTLLQQVQSQMFSLQLPRIDDTLAVLVTAAAGR